MLTIGMPRGVTRAAVRCGEPLIRPPCHLDCSAFDEGVCPVDGRPCDQAEIEMDDERRAA